MRFAELKTHDELLETELSSEEKAEWERLTTARALAAKLIEYRAKNGLTQTQLAFQLGMKQPAIARLESGEHNPRLDTLIDIAEHLEIPIGPLFKSVDKRIRKVKSRSEKVKYDAARSTKWKIRSKKPSKGRRVLS